VSVLSESDGRIKATGVVSPGREPTCRRGELSILWRGTTKRARFFFVGSTRWAVKVKKPYPRPLSTLHLFPSCMTHRHHPSPKCSPGTAISSHWPTTFLSWVFELVVWSHPHGSVFETAEIRPALAQISWMPFWVIRPCLSNRAMKAAMLIHIYCMQVTILNFFFFCCCKKRFVVPTDGAKLLIQFLAWWRVGWWFAWRFALFFMICKIINIAPGGADDPPPMLKSNDSLNMSRVIFRSIE
jgi:hypothetical protein